jgi:hypothetical protein
MNKTNSRNLSLSKGQTYFDCPFKAFLRYHKWITERERPIYLKEGIITHKIIENYLNSKPLYENIDEDLSMLERASYDAYFEAFKRVWTSRKRTFLSAESSVLYPLEGYFKNWVIKADIVFEEDGKIYVGDVKTTSGYGAATASFYLNSPQTLINNLLLREVIPNVSGTKIFIISKNKKADPLCFEEEVLLTSTDLKKAEWIFKNLVKHCNNIEEGGTHYQNPLHCKPFRGSECPYVPICEFLNLNPIDIEDIPFLKEWYETERDPEDYLNIKRKE